MWQSLDVLFDISQAGLTGRENHAIVKSEMHHFAKCKFSEI